MFGDHGIDPRLRRGVRRSAQREGDGAETELEQPVAARGLEVIVAFGRGPRDQLDLPVVEYPSGGYRLAVKGNDPS
jgi:hypothetical protein